MRVPDHGIPDSVIKAYERVAKVLLCFCCDWPDTNQQTIRSCLLQRGFAGEEAERFARLTYYEARDELMSDPALNITPNARQRP